MQSKDLEESLKNWRVMIKPYQQPDNRKAIIQLLNTFVPFLGMCVLLYLTLYWSYLATLGLAVVTGFFLLRIFVIQHDCGHQSFTSSRRWNIVIGFFSSFFSTIPFTNWKRIHNAHHAHNGKMEYRGLGDINFLTTDEYHGRSRMGKFLYRFVRHYVVQFLIIPIVYVAIIQRYPFADITRKKKLLTWHVINQLMMVAIYGTLGYLLGWQKLILVQVPVVIIFGILAFWLFYVQHQHEENYNEWQENWDHLPASILGSTYYRLPRLLRWFSGNIGYHHIHHLSSRIPNYHLIECFNENPVINRFVKTLNFRQSLACVGHKLWDGDQRRMITFREFSSRQASVKS